MFLAFYCLYMSKKKIAQEHIETLFVMSQKEVYTNPERANRYISLIRKIAMKLRVGLPRPIKKSFCKHCYVAFAPGTNCRVRTRDGKLIYYCFNCKKYTKLLLKEK